MRWGFGAVALLATIVAGCGGNSTPTAVSVFPANATVLLNNSAQFTSSVSGASATTVTWQVCLPASLSGSGTPPPANTKPTNCTSIPGVPTPKGSTVLTGYGTITQTGLYTAPSTLPTPNTALILVTSTVNTNAFVTANLTIDSGIRVQITPATATLDPGESLQFTATVRGTTNTAVSWSLSGSATAASLGTVSASGLYTAPPTSPGTVTLTAQSSADPTKTATATITVSTGAVPTLTGLDPTVAAQGSAQQDIYITGTNFDSASQVIVTPPSQPAITLPTTSIFFLSSTQMRATLPASVLAASGTVSVQVESGTVPPNFSGTSFISVFPVRPALIDSSLDSVPQTGGNASTLLTGGYFSSATTTTFDGQAVAANLNSSRQLALTIAAGNLSEPGLHPIVVQNSGVAAGDPSLAALNIAVTPSPALIPAAPLGGAIPVGAGPSAIAIDEADGIAVIANTTGSTVTLLNLATDTVKATIPVGNTPTGVAVDDLLAHHLALVVNSVDNSISVIDLSLATPAVTKTISLGLYSPSLIPVGTVPFSIGINPLTHRAFIANRSTNVGTILDLVNTNSSVSCTTPPCPVATVGGSTSVFTGTGQNPAVAIDPKLNWAVVTPGGAGTVNMVDLGRAANANEPNGRAPEAIASLTISQTIQGIGLNPETHQALLSDPTTGAAYTFSLLDNTVTPVTQPTPTGTVFSQVGFGAAAATPLENIGIAVNANSTAVVVDLQNSVVLQTINGLGGATVAQAVAIDPASNQAVVANHDDNTVTILSLSSPADPIKPLQITESSPQAAYTSSNSLTLTIVGSGFNGTSQVLLDGAPITPVSVSANGRELVATIPTSLSMPNPPNPPAIINPLASARHFTVQVSNGATVSNVTALLVIQPIAVGKTPIGVAVDTDRDLAVISNSGDGTASLVSLAPPSSTSPQSLGPVGPVLGSPILAGTTPAAVAVIPRLGMAVITNAGSNNTTVLDYTGTTVATATTSPCSGCTSPAGVAINQDTAQAAYANTDPTGPTSPGDVAFFSLPPASGVTPSQVSVDHDPVAVAIDPNLDYAAVATASQASSVEFIDMSTTETVGRSTSALDNPSAIIFDPLNQVMLTANSLLNQVVIIDPATFVETPVSVGIAPTSLDYNFQTSTLVTANWASRTMSVLDYVCPPGSGAPAACVGPEVRAVLGLGGSQASPLVLGANAVAIDPKLNLAVLVDPDNNRILLVPLPH